jgi:hypothetical protein
MRNCEFLHQFLSAESKSQQNLATVGLAARASNETLGLKPVRQLNCAVMLNLQTLGEYSDRGNVVSGHPFYHQQSLMLMRLDPRSTRSVFAEVQEAADFVAEICKRRVIDASLSTGSLAHDAYIISYYDIIVPKGFFRSFYVRGVRQTKRDKCSRY